MNIDRDIRGVGLLELMLALAISAAMVLGVLHYVQVVERNMRVTQAATMVRTLTDSGYRWLETVGEASDTLPSNIIPSLVKASYLPSSYAGLSVSPWHAAVVMQVKGRAHSERLLHITFEGLPSQDCALLKRRLVQESAALFCRAATVGQYSLSGDF